MVKQTFPIIGMGCASCVSRVENTIKELPGVQNVSVSLAANTVQVEYDSGILTPEQISDAVKGAGYDLLIEEVETDTDFASDCNYQQMLKESGFAVIFTLIMFLVNIGATAFPQKTPILIGLAALFVFYFGRRFLISAFKQLKHFKANMDTLVSISILVSLFSGNFLSCAMIVTFVLIGRTMEERAKRSTSDSIRKLKALQPAIACKVGEIIQVKAGERVPADGIIMDGTASFDESMMTGESEEVAKQMADQVFAGTLCLSGNVMVSVQKVGKGTMLSSITDMIREAQGSKAKIQSTVDKISGIFVPAVIAIAILAWIFNGMQSFIAVLVVACPCSLGLAIPTAVVAGIGRAAKEGVLVKNADAFRTACKVDVVAFDKTGTVTEGVSGYDKVRANSREAIDKLKALGIDVVMLSGDNPDKTEAAATEVGIWKFVANMLPGDKVSYTKRLQDEGHKVAMVGDGINDSAALAKADFSVAMGSGTDVAMDAAMCTVIVPDLRKVPKMVELSKRVSLIINENLFWAFFYNVCAIPLAFFGKLSPAMAAACMALSSVCVVCNSVRLKLHKIV